MYISKFKIESYKSFQSSEEISLSEGFNVIVGQNNIGKSSLAEALSTRFNNIPHRSLLTSPEKISPSGPESKVTLTFTISPDEMLSIIKNQMKTFFFPINSNRMHMPDEQKAVESTFQQIMGNHVLLEAYATQGDSGAKFIGHEITSDKAIQLQFNSQTNQIELTQPINIPGNTPHQSQFPNQLFQLLRSRIYIFRAERFNLAESPSGANRILNPDASNLPEVLSSLSTTNPPRFAKFNRLVNIIFPQIRQITAPLISNNTFRISVWNIDPDLEREDLAVSLQQSGTGVGQILAILYVVLTAELPQVIIIDEPQSFLHPGAIRKLIDILKTYPQHQYILTTHSPTVVTAANPDTLLMVTKDEAESHIQVINKEETKDMERYLAEIGARISDVFGADNILWVEGSTEETCFPLITKYIAKLPLLGTTILGVKNTGDFEGDQSELAFEVYKRLSQGNGLLPKAIAFIFDPEGRSEKQREDLERMGKGTVYFLKRRMYENYLLSSEAISVVTSSLDNFSPSKITAESINAWLTKNKWNSDFFDISIEEKDRTNELWLEKVHGAKVLEKIFSDLSEARYSYDKVRHGELLTKWIIENSPAELKDITELLSKILKPTNDI